MPFPLNKQGLINLDINPAYGLQATCPHQIHGAAGCFIPYLNPIDPGGEKISGDW
jgi:hypothetical protein